MTDRTNRRRAGTPVGGQFAPQVHREATGRLGDEPAEPGSDVDDVYLADETRLWEMVRHPDEEVRMRATKGLLLNGDQLRVLLSPDQPVGVRLEAARSAHCGVAELAASDPDPLVRLAALSGWDLPDGVRSSLEADPAVSEAARRFSVLV